jgi:RNA polymerase sigma-70 factor (ECF subfamily)
VWWVDGEAEAVLLRAVLGLDAQTAGQVLGKRAGAVRTAAHRGLRTLARQLETERPELIGDRRTRGIRPPAR